MEMQMPFHDALHRRIVNVKKRMSPHLPADLAVNAKRKRNLCRTDHFLNMKPK